jgi:pyridoxine/pyridoxamine 5'-phosphate oxidase
MPAKAKKRASPKAIPAPIPAPTPVRMPAGYVPKGTRPKFLPWSWVTERLERSHNYWICTTRADGRPHAIPVWGVYVDDAIAFSTDPSSLKARNMKRNPLITVHLESGEEVVIVEGKVEKIKLRQSIDDAYNAKYKMRLSTFPESAGIYQLRPKIVLAWRERDFVTSSTRWQFS